MLLAVGSLLLFQSLPRCVDYFADGDDEMVNTKLYEFQSLPRSNRLFASSVGYRGNKYRYGVSISAEKQQAFRLVGSIGTTGQYSLSISAEMQQAFRPGTQAFHQE